MIRATCHTADNALALEFDATPWFREADPQSIRHLADQNWSSVWIADALETRPGYEEPHQLVAYAATRLREESLEDPTWDALTCVVDVSLVPPKPALRMPSRQRSSAPVTTAFPCRFDQVRW